MEVTEDFFKVLGLKPAPPVHQRGSKPAESTAHRDRPRLRAVAADVPRRSGDPRPQRPDQPLSVSLPVVGVMPPGVRFLPDPGSASEPNYDVNGFVDFWLLAAPDETQMRNRGWNAVSRLRASVSLGQAQSEVGALATKQVEADARQAGLTVNVQLVQDELNRDARALCRSSASSPCSSSSPASTSPVSMSRAVFNAIANTPIVSGLLPAVRASSSGHAHTLKGTRTTAGRAERRLLGSIATVQIVLTVALLSGAALLIAPRAIWQALDRATTSKHSRCDGHVCVQ